MNLIWASAANLGPTYAKHTYQLKIEALDSRLQIAPLQRSQDQIQCQEQGADDADEDKHVPDHTYLLPPVFVRLVWV